MTVSFKLLSLKEIQSLFVCLENKNPNPKTELFFTNTFTLLVAVVLSARATDLSVNRVTKSLFEWADSPEKMIQICENRLSSIIRTIGLWRSKSRNIIQLSHQLINEHKGCVPSVREALEKLAGVGRKTANVVLNIAFQEETFPVDTHVFRVANRTGLAPGETVRKVEEGLHARVPNPWRQKAHHWLVLHGRYICKAQKPLCSICPIMAWCSFLRQKIEMNRLKSLESA